MMATFHVIKSSLSPLSVSESYPCSEFNFSISGRRIFGFPSKKLRSTILISRRLRVSSKLQESENQSNGDEPPESLFMKELKRRGMTPNSLLEESNKSSYLEEETKYREEDGDFSRRNAVSTDAGRNLSNQREQSMALNSEGIEGLIPRAKLLLTLGGTFFLGFWPLILITVGFFSALYEYFGPNFVHDASQTSITPPQFIDPYQLLEEERIPQTAPRLN